MARREPAEPAKPTDGTLIAIGHGARPVSAR